MAHRELLQKKLNKITKELFKKAIMLCYNGGITTVAPLGFSGDTILLFGTVQDGRRSVVSIRNYCNDAEQLSTDAYGHFLFYGRFHISLGVDFVTEQYWNIFNLVKHKIETCIEPRPKFANLDIPPRTITTYPFIS